MKKIKRHFSPHCKRVLINIIGKDIFNRVDSETKGILLLDAIKQFEQEMIQKFGSMYNYRQFWAKENGFKNMSEYQKYYETEVSGFKTQNDYRNFQCKKRGFKSRGDLYLFYAKKKGFKSLYTFYLFRHKKNGFNSQAEYRKALATSQGFKNYSQLLKSNKLKKFALHENRCVLDGGKVTNGN